MYFAIAVGHKNTDLVPSLFVLCVWTVLDGLKPVDNTVTGFSSCHLMAASCPFVLYRCCPRSSLDLPIPQSWLERHPSPFFSSHIWLVCHKQAVCLEVDDLSACLSALMSAVDSCLVAFAICCRLQYFRRQSWWTFSPGTTIMLSFLFSLAWLMVAHPFPQVLLGESVYHLKASCTGQILQVPPWLKQKSIFL